MNKEIIKNVRNYSDNDIEFDFETYMDQISFESYLKKIDLIEERLLTDEMTGWHRIDDCITTQEINKILEVSKDIRKNCDVFVVVGIGGSFLGAKMVIDALNSYFIKNEPEIIFAGTSLSSQYLKQLKKYLEDKSVCINFISKSGTTLEPSLVFDNLMDWMQTKYNNEEIKQRVFITTDRSSLLEEYGLKKEYTIFNIPKNIGGRYSVLTAVGLLPIAVAGFDINLLLKGARNIDPNIAYSYAIVRDDLYKKGKTIEAYTFYEEKLDSFGQWLKQLYAETQGKDGKGIYPAVHVNPRELHSVGQYIQEGEKVLFETVINIKTDEDIFTKYNMNMREINDLAVASVSKAHFDESIYSNIITIGKLNEETIGYLIHFFELSAAIGGYLLDVNPFDQPGVTKYKKLINESLGI